MEFDRKYSIDQLIKIAKDNKKELFTKDVSSQLNEASRFIIALNIKVGKNKVFAAEIYSAYCEWAINPSEKISFFKFFGSMFERRSSSRNYYLLNYNPAQLMKEVIKLRND